MAITQIPRESFLAHARHQKAATIAAVLNDFHTPAAAVMQLTPQRRRQIETIAGVKISSDVTWGLVALIMHREQGTPITPKPETTLAEVHAAIQQHTQKHAV